jgi:hypothetical protein
VTLGNAANEAVKGLSSSPMLLIVAVLNVLMLGLIFYVGASQRDERAMLIKYIADCRDKTPG